ncbi:MAG TPA: DUF998 domain-containing protein [Anaerolineales bacterium]|nr:DUF998 domain-containing protein [Anaerolineales bacterium]
MSTNNKIRLISAQIKMFLAGGVLAGPLFTLLWIIESVTRPDYNLLRHPVSSLALGHYGWMQSANFIVTGLLTLAFAIGLWLTLRPQKGSTWGPFLVAIWAVGLLGAGIFVTDPVSGYPPGTPDLIVNPTTHGALHDQISLLGFLSLTAACFVFTSHFAALGKWRWTVYSILTGVLFPIGIFLASAAFGQSESLVAFGGLIQRVTVTLGWTWLTLLALHVLKTMPER